MLCFDIEPAEFVQVLNNKRRHWLTISTSGRSTTHPNAHVYDRLSVYLTANSHVETQTAALLHSQCSTIRLQFVGVQLLAGGYDCGEFALAFAWTVTWTVRV